MHNQDTATSAEVHEALREVIDPEVGLDIVTMGLVYDVEVDAGHAIITHTLTTPGCPLERYITDAIRAVVYAQPGINQVTTRLVWEPRWTPAVMEQN
ncbi:MAG TPA: metal-sulfur cluster assembly factor [Longimicrobiales bacterium]|nr:metal-sulfur cluster assembly factor [Longimicrobiales bacterium]